MAAGGERKALGNGSGDYNKYYHETVQKGLFFFLHTNITLFRNVGKTFLGFADGRAANSTIAGWPNE